jgi:hypothetical protein
MLKLATILMILSTYIGYQDKRMLLVFADNESNKLLKQQQDLLNAELNGLKERDVEVKYFYAELNKAEFKKRNITVSFTVILVGKDGGDKLRSLKPLSIQKLYNTIDAMPMRQSEMKRHP